MAPVERQASHFGFAFLHFSLSQDVPCLLDLQLSLFLGRRVVRDHDIRPESRHETVCGRGDRALDLILRCRRGPMEVRERDTRIASTYS